MWWECFALILTVGAVAIYRKGPVAGLGCATLISLLFPCWIVQIVAGTSIDLRIGTSIIFLLTNLVHPARRSCWRFNRGDWAIFVLYFVHVSSDTWHDGFQSSHFVRAFGEWSIPYIAGRLAVQSPDDWRWLTGVAVIVATVLAFWATAEAITRVKFAEPVFGVRPADRTPHEALRMGLKRAEGPTRHPIWLAMIQLLLFPWIIAATVRSVRGDGPLWWVITPVCSIAGILATVSRGPALGTLIAFYLTTVFCLPRMRSYLVIAGIVFAATAFAAKGFFLDSLEGLGSKKWGGTRYNSIVELEGEQHRLTAMSSRWLVLSAYRRAVSEAGLLGYGTERTATFPVNVPLGPDAKQTVAEFWTIDCEYLLILLRFGWLGLAAFGAVCATSAWSIFKQSAFVSSADRTFPLAVTATLIATSFVLMVEWMPHDYGFVFLWLCGVANGPRLHRRAQLIV